MSQTVGRLISQSLAEDLDVDTKSLGLFTCFECYAKWNIFILNEHILLSLTELLCVLIVWTFSLNPLILILLICLLLGYCTGR